MSDVEEQTPSAKRREPLNRTVRVVLVDDHDIWRGGVRSMLDETEFEVVGEADSGKAALEVVR